MEVLVSGGLLVVGFGPVKPPLVVALSSDLTRWSILLAAPLVVVFGPVKTTYQKRRLHVCHPIP